MGNTSCGGMFEYTIPMNTDMLECKKVSPEEESNLHTNFWFLQSTSKNLIILFLPIEDILKVKSIYGDDFMNLDSLLHSASQDQLMFRFTQDILRVFRISQLPQLEIRNDCIKICTELNNIQRDVRQLSCTMITSRSGLEASTKDHWPSQDIDCTVNGSSWTFWSSDGSELQDKVDWLLYDFGTVAVISQVSVVVHQHVGMIYGFQKCWFELGFQRDEFHYKTREFTCLNTNEIQNFAGKHFDQMLPAARYIKFWMRGCHQKQGSDDKWYFVVNQFQVLAIPVRLFPQPVPKIFQIAEDLTSDHGEWFFDTSAVRAQYQENIIKSARGEY